MPTAVRKVDMITDMLRELLRDATFPLDEPLSTRDLAERYSVSRTPIRVALKHLAQEGGLLTYIQDRGYFPFVADDETFARAYLERAEIVDRARRAGPDGSRPARRTSDARAATFRELSLRSASVADDKPARLVEIILLDAAAHAADPTLLDAARANVFLLAPLRNAEQILIGHAEDAARLVRLFRAGKYDELVRAFRDYGRKRADAVPMLSRQIPRPKLKSRARIR